MSPRGGTGRGGNAEAESRRAIIINQKGLHARAAARFVELADGYDAEITVMCRGQSVSGTSIMGLMMLAAGPGAEVEITATGKEAVVAVASLAAFVEAGFDEE